MKKNICGIYEIINVVNKKRYIGKSVDIDARWCHHIRSLNNNKHHNRHLQKAWNKYGEHNFQFSVIEVCEEFELNQKEMHYIAKFNSTDSQYGYNLTFGGEGNVPTDDVRTRKSQLFSGENNPMFGRKGCLSPVYGIRKTQEQIQNMIDSRWTEEKRLANSVRVIGKNNPMFGRVGAQNSESRAVMCVETGMIFESMSLAAKWCHLKNSPMIGQVCLGKRKSAGKHPITGEKLHWKYVDITNQCEINDFAL